MGNRDHRIWKFPLDEAHRSACERSLVLGSNRAYRFGPSDLVLLYAKASTRRGAGVTSALVGSEGATQDDAESISEKQWGTAFDFVFWFDRCVATMPFDLEAVPGLVGVYRAPGLQGAQRIKDADVPAVLLAAGLTGRWSPTAGWLG